MRAETMQAASAIGIAGHPVRQEKAVPQGAAPEESLYLMGRPPIRHVLCFARNQALNPPEESALVDAWKKAHEVVRGLERSEAGVADEPPIAKLGPEYEPLLRELLKDPLIRNGFNVVPTDIAMVELDRMVVYQKH